MRVYGVVVFTSPDFIGSGSPIFYADKESAEHAAQEMARERRGETVSVVECVPVAAFRAEPVAVESVAISLPA